MALAEITDSLRCGSVSDQLLGLHRLNELLLRMNERLAVAAMIEPVLGVMGDALTAGEGDASSPQLQPAAHPGHVEEMLPLGVRVLRSMLEADPRSCRSLAKPHALSVLRRLLQGGLPDQDTCDGVVKLATELAATYPQSVLVSGLLGACLSTLDFSGATTRLASLNLAVSCAESVITREAAACMLAVVPQLCAVVDAYCVPALCHAEMLWGDEGGSRGGGDGAGIPTGRDVGEGSGRGGELGASGRGGTGLGVATWETRGGDAGGAFGETMASTVTAAQWGAIQAAARALSRFITVICCMECGAENVRRAAASGVPHGGSNTPHATQLRVPLWPRESVHHLVAMGVPGTLLRLLRLTSGAPFAGHSSHAAAASGEGWDGAAATAAPAGSPGGAASSAPSGSAPGALAHEVMRAVVRALARLVCVVRGVGEAGGARGPGLPDDDFDIDCDHDGNGEEAAGGGIDRRELLRLAQALVLRAAERAMASRGAGHAPHGSQSSAYRGGRGSGLPAAAGAGCECCGGGATAAPGPSPSSPLRAQSALALLAHELDGETCGESDLEAWGSAGEHTGAPGPPEGGAGTAGSSREAAGQLDDAVTLVSALLA